MDEKNEILNYGRKPDENWSNQMIAENMSNLHLRLFQW